ncbi:laccase domain protein [Alicyclobacillus hesperidum]|uniref:Purine nucleoside phosphorylase n=1 Tax=Alicyclobacillus hesperidum TaxID=89784 RepID=A0A1H2UZJ8_9BACL|nr:peptidoglycan editing factor PgeF [Alicyclobacillus hesperidum]GLV14583.1 laccase domain protein [Alicyclobacillus hesperidum]SDW61079.1 conserved hypothetical protein [Alicyclobacillus hesperidum]
MHVLTNIVGNHGGIGVRPGWAEAGVCAMFLFRHDDAWPAVERDVSYVGRIDPNDAAANRSWFLERLQLPSDCASFVRQVHGTDVIDVTRSMATRVADHAAVRPEGDAQVTRDVGVVLGILVADCAPVLFYDPVQRVVAAAHSGWRGTVKGISRAVVARMVNEYGSHVGDIRAAIGPCIRRCCYEVDETVAREVRGTHMERALLTRFGRDEKYWFSLPDAVRIDLIHAGLRPEHVDDCGLCTACRNQHLFSHRREQGQAGRQMAIIALTDPQR